MIVSKFTLVSRLSFVGGFFTLSFCEMQIVTKANTNAYRLNYITYRQKINNSNDRCLNYYKIRFPMLDYKKSALRAQPSKRLRETIFEVCNLVRTDSVAIFCAVARKNAPKQVTLFQKEKAHRNSAHF